MKIIIAIVVTVVMLCPSAFCAKDKPLVYVTNRDAVLYSSQDVPLIDLHPTTALELLREEGDKSFIRLKGKVLKDDLRHIESSGTEKDVGIAVFIWDTNERTGYGSYDKCWPSDFYAGCFGRVLPDAMKESESVKIKKDWIVKYAEFSITGWVTSKFVTHDRELAFKRGTIKGKILDDGIPADDCIVIIHRLWKRVDKNGEYEFIDLIPGWDYPLGVVVNDVGHSYYVSAKNEPLLNSGETLVYDTVDIADLIDQPAGDWEVKVHRGFVTVLSDEDNTMPRFRRHPFSLGRLIFRRVSSEEDLDESDISEAQQENEEQPEESPSSKQA